MDIVHVSGIKVYSSIRLQDPPVLETPLLHVGWRVPKHCGSNEVGGSVFRARPTPVPFRKPVSSERWSGIGPHPEIEHPDPLYRGPISQYFSVVLSTSARVSNLFSHGITHSSLFSNTTYLPSYSLVSFPSLTYNSPNLRCFSTWVTLCRHPQSSAVILFYGVWLTDFVVCK